MDHVGVRIMPDPGWVSALLPDVDMCTEPTVGATRGAFRGMDRCSGSNPMEESGRGEGL